MRVKFITFGCSRNLADTELMKGLVKQAGHELVEEGQEVTVVNTCFVKQDTERKILKLLGELKGRVVVTGCLSQARPELIEAFPACSFLGVGRIEGIVEALSRHVVDVDEGFPDFCSERVLTNPLISIVPVSEGCLGNCTYCCTRLARGKLKSRSISSILTQIKQDLSKGVRELWLTSQDMGCYGLDIKSSLPELINAVTNVDGDFRVRVGMMNPQHALRFLPELIQSFRSLKMYKFLHLPVQSGSDKVLKGMNRGYFVADFKRAVRAFRKAFPDLTLSTDVICGYPEEGGEEWRETLDLIKEVRPDVINISRFFGRPGTPAALLRQHPSWVVKERSRELTVLHKSISLACNKKRVGRECTVLVTEDGVGRNESYKPVAVNAPLGSFINVRIVSASIFCLKGLII